MALLVGVLAFWALVALRCRRPAARADYRAKPGADWALDVVSLLAQGVLLPLAHVALAWAVTGALAPELRGSVALPGWLVLPASFVLLDALYYANHRLLHARALWPLHLVHHTVTDLDVLGTARNTLWAHLLLVPFWVTGAAVLVLEDPRAWLAGVTLTAALDLWRHSDLDLPAGGRLERLLGLVLVLPRDHAWHHAADAPPGNFGQNLNVWDRLFGTWLGAPAFAGRPERLGVPTTLSLPRRLLWPFPAHPGAPPPGSPLPVPVPVPVPVPAASDALAPSPEGAPPPGSLPAPPPSSLALALALALPLPLFPLLPPA